MDKDLRQLVQRRAGSSCENCHFPLQFSIRPPQIDHIIAEKHGGKTIPENLAFSCYRCNLHKGPNVAGIDPLTNQIVRLFNPRLDDWSEHFRWSGATLLGQTPIGRVTVAVLSINDPLTVATRAELMQEGAFPH